WGNWTLIADEFNHANPMTVSLTLNASASSLISPSTFGTITPGTIDGGGVERNKRWDWTISRGTAATGFMSSQTLKFQAPSGQTSVTLKNAKFTQGGDTPVTTLTDANDFSQNFLNTVTFAPGVSCPYVRYLYGAYPASSWVDPSDIPPTGQFEQRYGL